jgi:beta-galactosidase/beta-glucuronidase
MKSILSISIIISLATAAFSNDFDKQMHEIVNLSGKWKFMIGDNKAWAAEKLNLNEWEDINVPSSWENQGFPGYDGYAWYRTEFSIGTEYSNTSLQLLLGYIDDVDEVFLNGVKIGQKGSFPPNFWTAYNAERNYSIPPELLKYGQKNTLAVRVYDTQLDGGIVWGKVGVWAKNNPMPCDLNLEGLWKFKFGDNKDYISSTYNDDQWMQIMVPGSWEDQVSKSYDGFGWYRKQIKLDPLFTGKSYVLMVGKIDDLDEVYLNDKLVGHTGTIMEYPLHSQTSDECTKERFYYLTSDALKPGQNCIAIRVLDTGGEGGILVGPIGLVELKRFVGYWREKNKKFK